MKNQLIIIGVAILLICVGLSGCNEQNTEKPSVTIIGPSTGEVNTVFANGVFKVEFSDPNGDKCAIYVDWGDGTIGDSDWVGGWSSYQYPSIQNIGDHTWTKAGTYTMKAKVRNTAHVESEWYYHYIKIY